MAWSFRKSVKIAPGVRLNLSKKGVGMSAGVRGARVGFNSRGSYTSVSIPGTGIYKTEYFSKNHTGRNNILPSEFQETYKEFIKKREVKTKFSDPLVSLVVVNLVVFIFSPLVGLVTSIASGLYYWQKKQQKIYLAQKNLHSALASYNAEKYTDAVTLLQQASTDFPQDASILYYLGMSQLRMGVCDESSKSLKSYLDYSPNDYEVKIYLIISLKELGRYDEAVSLTQTLPDAPEILLYQKITHLSECLEAKGQLESAIEVLKAAPLRKRNVDENLLDVIYRLGSLYERLGKLSSAQKHYERVYRTDANYKDIATKLEFVTNSQKN